MKTDAGTYRIINRSELTEEQFAVLRRVSRERVVERVCVLLGEGKIALSQVQARYGKIMGQVGKA
jgi:hypothetical protein